MQELWKNQSPNIEQVLNNDEYDVIREAVPNFTINW